jgi:CHAD domain-containing protein
VAAGRGVIVGKEAGAAPAQGGLPISAGAPTSVGGASLDGSGTEGQAVSSKANKRKQLKRSTVFLLDPVAQVGNLRCRLMQDGKNSGIIEGMRDKHMTDIVGSNYYLFGLEALLERLPALGKEVDGVRAADDIEYVHRMRVASRRIRTALALFKDDLPPKHCGAWRAEMRRVTRALGAARDTDVQIEYVAELLEKAADPARRAGIERLLLRLRQQRARQQIKIGKVLDRLEDRHVVEDMAETLLGLVVHARVYEIDALPVDLYPRAGEAIRLRLEEFLAYEQHVAHPERIAELHAMRIAAKHLRYTLEICAPLYSSRLRKPIKVLKEIQELLGQIHDCDVWLAAVPQFVADEQARTLEFFGDLSPAAAFLPGLQALEEDRRQERWHLYLIFQRFWELTKDHGIWDRIRQTIAPRAEPAGLVMAEVEAEDEAAVLSTI